jgi:hypothetical protein
MVIVATSVLTECTVNVFRTNGEVAIIGESSSEAPSDVFEYVEAALAYFRFAIQEMDARMIEIEVRITGRLIQSTQITPE